MIVLKYTLDYYLSKSNKYKVIYIIQLNRK